MDDYGIVRGPRPGRGLLVAEGISSRSVAVEKAKKMSRLSESYFTVVDLDGDAHGYFHHGKELHPYRANDPSKPRTWYEVRAKDKVLVKTKDKAKALRYGREKAKSRKTATVVVFVTWKSARSHKSEFVESFAPNGDVSTVARVGRDAKKPGRARFGKVRATAFKELKAGLRKKTVASLRKLHRTTDFPEVKRAVSAELRRRGARLTLKKRTKRDVGWF